MQQEVQYSVEKLGRVSSPILSEKETPLVSSYTLENEQFQEGVSELSVNIYNLDGEFLTTVRNVRDYKILGNNIGTRATQLTVDPVNVSVSQGFLGDVVVEYEAFNNLFGAGEFFISEISTDRTEVRAKSVQISDTDLRTKALSIYRQLNSNSFFSEIYLDFDSSERRVIGTNILTEVIDGQQVVTFKLYEPLSDDLSIKDTFRVLGRIGEPTRFVVKRTVKIIPDKIPQLRGPNFGVEIESADLTTDYMSSTDLLSYRKSGSLVETVKKFGQSGVHISVDYSDFKNFVHFSSAVERLENARYKFELLWSYQSKIQETEDRSVKTKYSKLAEGLISNFDPYENYLYYESGSTCWPKVSNKRPYQNVTNYLDIEGQDGFKSWWENAIEQADTYDLHNEDILIGTIPLAIREDPNNEPYVTFVHMIGQHFDDLWVYAKAITDRYKADNRLDFGVSKDLVKHAIEGFGIDLYETSQNLGDIFDLFRSGTYERGEELSITDVRQIDQDQLYQPMSQDDYLKEVYKRIYHNVPILLKSKGTLRCIRVLLNCFGIPEDILSIKLYGGIDSLLRPYFDPGERVYKPIDKIRVDNKDVPVREYVPGEDGLNTFKENSVLSRYVEVDKRPFRYSDDDHRIEIGFGINEASSKFIRDSLKDTTINLEDSFGDPRNQEDQYGDPYKLLKQDLLKDLNLEKRFQSPAAIIRLVKYFDLTFFRLVKDFLPARAVMTSGVVVEDNLLHRNRYRGVKVSWENETLSVSLPVGSIEGSSGGSVESGVCRYVTGSWIYGTNFRPIIRECVDGECRKTWTVNHVTQSRTGKQIYERSVFDDSPKYNGIFSGSNLTVTEGWLTSKNPHHKALQSIENYGVCLYFLDLPEPALCSVRTIAQSYVSNCYLVSSSYGVNFYSTLDFGNPIKSDSRFDALVDCTKEDAYFTAESASFAESVGARGYMGWYERHEPKKFDSRDKEFITPRPDMQTVKETWWKLGPKYISSQKHSYRLEVQLDYLNEVDYYESGQGNYGYRPGDFILTWRFIGQDNYPPNWTKAVWTEIGDVTYKIKPRGQEAVEGILPTQDMYGTDNGYCYLVLNLGVEGIENIEQFGIKTAAGGYRGPWISSKGFIDADWYECYDIWGTGSLARQDRWTVVSSSLGK